MTPFELYGQYYDLIYADKDYAGEVDYIHKCIQAHMSQPDAVLDLGCGTGRHMALFSEKGYKVAGVDRSPEMLKLAKQNLNAVHTESALYEGDVRTIRINQSFDVVMALFHVMSYQVGNQDLRQAFATAQEHLKEGGLFLFDCWYGPGVLTDLPEIRTKEFENEDVKLKRISVPKMYAEENRVDVQFDLRFYDKKKQESSELKEIHVMRYLFNTELELLFEEFGFEQVFAEEWMTGESLSYDSWNAFFGIRKHS